MVGLSGSSVAYKLQAFCAYGTSHIQLCSFLVLETAACPWRNGDVKMWLVLRLLFPQVLRMRLCMFISSVLAVWCGMLTVSLCVVWLLLCNVPPTREEYFSQAECPHCHLGTGVSKWYMVTF